MKMKLRKGYTLFKGREVIEGKGQVIELSAEEIKGQTWKVEPVIEDKATEQPPADKMVKEPVKKKNKMK